MKYSVPLNVRISKPLRDALRAKARKEKRKYSVVIREVLDNGLNANAAELDKMFKILNKAKELVAS